MTAIQGLDVFGVCSKIVEGSKKLNWIWIKADWFIRKGWSVFLGW
jgi:hypothetical protein